MKEMLELENHTKNANFRVGERSELTEMKKAIDDLLKFKSKVLDITKVKIFYQEDHLSGSRVLATRRVNGLCVSKIRTMQGKRSLFL